MQDASFVKLHVNAKYEIGHADIAAEEEEVDGVYRQQYWHGDGGVGEEDEGLIIYRWLGVIIDLDR